MAKYKVIQDDKLMNNRGMKVGDVVDADTNVGLSLFLRVVDPDGAPGYWYKTYFEKLAETPEPLTLHDM